MPESSKKGRPVPFDHNRFKRFHPDAPTAIPPGFSSEVRCTSVRQQVREDAERRMK